MELVSAMNQLLDQHRSQMAEIRSMGGKIDRMEGEVVSMGGR